MPYVLVDSGPANFHGTAVLADDITAANNRQMDARYMLQKNKHLRRSFSVCFEVNSPVVVKEWMKRTSVPREWMKSRERTTQYRGLMRVLT